MIGVRCRACGKEINSQNKASSRICSGKCEKTNYQRYQEEIEMAITAIYSKYFG